MHPAARPSPSWLNRAERRRELSKRAAHIEAPPEIDAKVREQVASAISGRVFAFRPLDSVQERLRRECPQMFVFAAGLGFVLSFDLPEMTPAALARGVIAYSLTRIRAA